jgi:hypothetical protein
VDERRFPERLSGQRRKLDPRIEIATELRRLQHGDIRNAILINTIEGGIPTFNIAESRRQLTNYGEATIREICWNKWRGYIGVGVTCANL